MVTVIRLALALAVIVFVIKVALIVAVVAVAVWGLQVLINACRRRRTAYSGPQDRRTRPAGCRPQAHYSDRR